MFTYNNLKGHLRTILHHKKLVRSLCFRCGLYKQGIMHDWSKYSPSEFIKGVWYYQGGVRSANYGEIKEKGYSTAWLHHKGRNKHHFEYWIDYSKKDGSLIGAPMPVKYVVEMFCDRVAASKNYNPKTYTDGMPLAYYEKNKAHYTIDPESRALLEKLLKMLKAKGEDYTFRYIRKRVLKNQGIAVIKYNLPFSDIFMNRL
ncbi:MAG: DUF5662 family protein [Lachnospiraceae bacterium]|jgi:hypothetical protein|nr:DUF5662 family protein [Lachnospiraceae bacterium]MEE3460369.1 DUF5662 family protein [Lachnospiraceae bacterium]